MKPLITACLVLSGTPLGLLSPPTARAECVDSSIIDARLDLRLATEQYQDLEARLDAALVPLKGDRGWRAHAGVAMRFSEAKAWTRCGGAEADYKTLKLGLIVGASHLPSKLTLTLIEYADLDALEGQDSDAQIHEVTGKNLVGLSLRWDNWLRVSFSEVEADEAFKEIPARRAPGAHEASLFDVASPRLGVSLSGLFAADRVDRLVLALDDLPLDPLGVSWALPLRLERPNPEGGYHVEAALRWMDALEAGGRWDFEGGQARHLRARVKVPLGENRDHPTRPSGFDLLGSANAINVEALALPKEGDWLLGGEVGARLYLRFPSVTAEIEYTLAYNDYELLDTFPQALDRRVQGFNFWCKSSW